MNPKPLVIYHSNCADGFTAAWVIWTKYPDWEFYPGKYQEEPPDVTGRRVYFVDFSYKRPVILEMAKKAKSITILDHHKTAEADLVDLPENVSVTFDMTKSGSHLAWNYFRPSKEIPALIQYVEDRDLWKFSLRGTKALSEYIFSHAYDFEVWSKLFLIFSDSHTLAKAEEAGEAILRKKDKDTEELLANKFQMTIRGHKVWVANLPYTFSSEAGHLLAKEGPFGATFYLDGKYAIFSLRSIEGGQDVPEIAKQFGGGGHKHAAGFKVPYYFIREGL
jgi:oligoribonuclease NrnB/cAMP/cGMP phosphodiesterase (DHH superfamily)